MYFYPLSNVQDNWVVLDQDVRKQLAYNNLMYFITCVSFWYSKIPNYVSS